MPTHLRRYIVIDHASPASPRVDIGNISISRTVHAPRIATTIDHCDTIPRIHTTLITRRQRITRRASRKLITRNQSLKAIIFPSTLLGICLATSISTQTRQQTTRGTRHNRSTSIDAARRSLTRHSHTSDRHTISPLRVTSSTIRISTACVALTRIVSRITTLIGRHL